MQVFKHTAGLIDFLNLYRSKGAIIGFVPTMGALHKGHLSLVNESLKNSDLTIVSIFVNPTQFNNPNDLRNYPRNFEQDRQLLEKTGCHAIFVPSEEEMYPEPDNRVFKFDGIDTIMEGEHRPGHFNGVAQIVSKFFEIVKPHKAFFGQKDFQQLAIIRQLVAIEKYQIDIVACPIIREDDGLAMSSRNLLLTTEHRQISPIIHQTLMKAVSLCQTKSPAEITEWVTETINRTQILEVEYFQIVNSKTLIPVKSFNEKGEKTGCIAVWAGKVRLIDNIVFNS
jgi:pantoate--beta-alanine ligase